MVNCSVLGCKNRVERAMPGVSFHRFPHGSPILEKWVLACGRKNWMVSKYGRICSVHFEKSCYRGSRKNLFPLACPTKFIHHLSSSRDAESPIEYIKSGDTSAPKKKSVTKQLLCIKEPVAKDPAVKTCLITACTSASVGGRGISFFNVENEVKADESKRELWMNALQGPVAKNAFICGCHFKPEDFILNAITKKYVLKRAAVPCVFSKEEKASTWAQHVHMIYNTGSPTKKEDKVLLLDATATRGTTPCITVTSSSADAPSECALLGNESEGTLDALGLADDDVTYEVIDGDDDDDKVAVNSDNGDEQVAVDSDNGDDEPVAVNSDNRIDDDGTAPETRARFACNVCLRPIVGFRYSCVECVDFDMCSSCEARGEHALHFVLRVPTGRPQDRVSTVIAAVRLALITTDVKVEPEIKIEQDTDIQPDPLAPFHTDLDTNNTKLSCLDPSETESITTTIDTVSEDDIPKLREIKKKTSKRRKCNLRLNQDESSSDSEDIEAESEEIMHKYLKAATEKRVLESDLGINTKAVKRRRLPTKVPSTRNPRELSFRSRKRYNSKDD